jgi:hypothetical protein
LYRPFVPFGLHLPNRSLGLLLPCMLAGFLLAVAAKRFAKLGLDTLMITLVGWSSCLWFL